MTNEWVQPLSEVHGPDHHSPIEHAWSPPARQADRVTLTGAGVITTAVAHPYTFPANVAPPVPTDVGQAAHWGGGAGGTTSFARVDPAEQRRRAAEICAMQIKHEKDLAAITAAFRQEEICREEIRCRVFQLEAPSPRPPILPYRRHVNPFGGDGFRRWCEFWGRVAATSLLGLVSVSAGELSWSLLLGGWWVPVTLSAVMITAGAVWRPR
jgi:hypothetical protein